MSRCTNRVKIFFPLVGNESYGLEATETKYISLEKLIFMELEINRRDLTNRVMTDSVG
jgi:hypothetical protein